MPTIPDVARHRVINYWNNDPYFPPPSSPPPIPDPTSEHSYDRTFIVLQHNANRIGNKLIELGVVMERNKVKVAVVIQESKLSFKFKKNYIRNYTTLRKDSHYGQGGRLPILIHRAITFSRPPSSPEALTVLPPGII